MSDIDEARGVLAPDINTQAELCPFCASNVVAMNDGRGCCVRCGAEADEWNRRDLARLQTDALKAEVERLREALKVIKYSGEDGTQDQIAPDMWEFCIDTADDALAKKGQTSCQESR